MAILKIYTKIFKSDKYLKFLKNSTVAAGREWEANIRKTQVRGVGDSNCMIGN